MSSQLVVSAAQMRAIEGRMFEAGMPVAALMEKVALAVASRILRRFPRRQRLGLAIGSGHNGGDGLVIGRELHLAGRQVCVWLGCSQLKPLTASHAEYLRRLGATFVSDIEDLAGCDLLIDAMFGIGLTRQLTDPWAAAVAWINAAKLPVVSIDLPSGLDTDTGDVMGSCVRAQITYCLGLWKRGVWQDEALAWVGQVERVEFGIPAFALAGVTGSHLLEQQVVRAMLPMSLPPATHKYRRGHLLLACGSVAYAGAAVLSALGARASGAGMVTVAVPQSLRGLLHHWVPEALVRGCPETESGEIDSLEGLDFSRYSALALGPGMGATAERLLDRLFAQTQNLTWILDADGLNALARLGTARLQERAAATVLTPHAGEFGRLFGQISLRDRIAAAAEAADQTGAVVLLKGAKTVIAGPNQVWINPESTPALARGGSGDVLAGLVGGLLAQGGDPVSVTAAGAWWHSQTALQLELQRGPTGVDPVHLAQALPATWAQIFPDAGSPVNPRI